MRFWGGRRRKKNKANHKGHLHQELGIEDPDPPDHLVGVQAYIPVPEWASTWDIVADVFRAKRHVGSDEFIEKLNGPCDWCPLSGVCKPREQGKPLWEL